jgi:hypothetical protein
MRRKASDNVYLHKDFHGALSAGIEYLHRRYGPQAVEDYLRQFARSYYAPLRDDIRTRGLVALKEHFEDTYRREGVTPQVILSDDELVVKVESCPAVAHMRAHGYAVAELFYETTKGVNEALCEGSPFCAELVEYEPQTGRAAMRFRRKSR